MLLQGKKAIVTGGGSGIGRAICLALASEGATVAVTDINPEFAKAVADEIYSIGGEAIHKKLDVTNKTEIKQQFEEIIGQFGKIDILCPNAGVSTMNPIVSLTEEEWDFNFNVNTKGVFFCCQTILPHMIEKGGGKIVITASMAAKRGIPLLAHYVASKYAVVGFMKTLALEAAKYNIIVNAVCPGLVKTSMQEREIVWEAKLRGLTPDDVRNEYIQMTPLGRLEEPEDVARVVVILASGYTNFMTGQAINVTGGIETN
jgi:NAD(P)-dependent dehydrogenase (short-subunit alcohol dehydrogenase family)